MVKKVAVKKQVVIRLLEPLDDDDKTLGAKIRHLAGITGYRFGLSHFSNKLVANAVGVDEATWSRMKAGKLAPTEDKLSRLVRYLCLDEYDLDFQVFLVPSLAHFKEILKQHRVGAHGGPDLDYIRSALMRARNFRPDGITIERSAGVRAGGLGAGMAAGKVAPILHPGDRVTLRISHPGDGHLFVLNDCPDGEVTCLMPSLFAPETAVRGTTTRLPTFESDQASIPIGASLRGEFRLFAIWTEKPVEVLTIDSAKAVNDELYVLSPLEFREIAEWVGKQDKPKAGASPVAYEIRAADYSVK